MVPKNSLQGFYNRSWDFGHLHTENVSGMFLGGRRHKKVQPSHVRDQKHYKRMKTMIVVGYVSGSCCKGTPEFKST